MTSEQTAYLALGFIARPHGVRGEVRVSLYNPASTALAGLERVYLATPADGAPAPYAVTAVRPTNDAILLTLDGVTDRDAADELRGREVLAARRDLPPLAEDEVYLGDLVGCEVVAVAGDVLGTIAAVVDHGPHPTLVIHDGDAERMLPYVPAFINQVDLEARRVVVDPPEDLPASSARRTGQRGRR